MTRKLFKLTNRNMQTHKGFQWVLGQWTETDGTGGLCGPGWLHAYSDPALALFMNPIHADYKSNEIRLFEAEGEERYKDDYGLKCGVTRLRVVAERSVTLPTVEQHVCFGIYCALEVYNNQNFKAWANGWLENKDRSAYAARTTAFAAAAEAYAAEAYAAEAAEAYAAAFAAEAYAAAAFAAAATAYAAAAFAYARRKNINFAAVAQKAMGHLHDGMKVAPGGSHDLDMVRREEELTNQG